MQIIQIISLILCLITGSTVLYYYHKIRRLLNENSDETLYNSFHSLIKKLTIVNSCFIGSIVIYIIILIIKFIFIFL